MRATQRVAFGTSGHRGTSLERSFNEWHVLAITQAICEYRAQQRIDGPLFIGVDTHALSAPAFQSALEVLAANGVETLISAGGEFTPTPAISHAILVHNRGRDSGLADGIVVTPSHNPPSDGGFKYNPTNGGPADTTVTNWIEARANALLEAGLQGVRRMSFEQARRAATTHEHDFVSGYVADLGSVLDLEAVRASGIRLGVDPLGGAGVHYWARIADHYGLNLEVVSEQVDPTFRFMTLDWDGRIRMDPSSAWAMQRLLAIKDRYDIAFGCDTDHDRHGIVTRSAGLMPTNHYLSVAIDYLYRERQGWSAQAAVGKTVVSSAMIDRVAAKLGIDASTRCRSGSSGSSTACSTARSAFVGEESAGATLNRRDGSVWTTDKDGIVPALLSAEITARTGRDPGELYAALAARVRRTGLRSRRCAGDAGAEEAAVEAVAAADSVAGAGRRPHRAGARPRARQRRRRSAASRSSPPPAGSPRVRRAPRTSTRSTPRASAAPSICRPSSARRRPWSMRRCVTEP